VPLGIGRSLTGNSLLRTQVVYLQQIVEGVVTSGQRRLPKQAFVGTPVC